MHTGAGPYGYPALLSGGQQQRAAIARTLAMRPKVMLLDEPTSALDPELVGEVLRVIRGLAEEGNTMILVTHEMQFAREVSHKVLFLHQGRVGEQGTPADMFGHPRSDRLRQFLARIRGVLELLIIYLLFFSSVEFVTQVATAFGFVGLAKLGYPFIISVAAISSTSAAYSTEVVRGALAAIPKGHIEGAMALGLPGRRIFRRKILPQMLRIAFLGINNVWQTTIKDTALVSVVSLQELMRTVFFGAGSTRNLFLSYAIAGVTFLLITLISQVGFNRVERALTIKSRS